MLSCSILFCIPFILVFNIDDVTSYGMGGRLLWPIGASIGLILIQIYSSSEILKVKAFNIILNIVVIIYFGVMCYGTNDYMKKCVYFNEVDKYLCTQIRDSIIDYEKNTGKKIELLEVHYKYTGEGLSKDVKYKKIQQSYILLCMPIRKYLSFFWGIDIETVYIHDESVEWNQNFKIEYKDNNKLEIYINS